MSHGKVIDFSDYQNQHDPLINSAHDTASEELIHAIQALIQRLRDHEPMALMDEQ